MPDPCTNPADTASAILRQDGAEVDAYLREVLARESAAPARLIEAISYSVMAGGKRLRPTLVLESFRACGGSASQHARLSRPPGRWNCSTPSAWFTTTFPRWMTTICAAGRPTNHKVFGEAMAILAGDAMMTLAFEILSTDADAALVPALVRELAHAAGPAGMIGGQVLDMAGRIDPFRSMNCSRFTA